MEVPDNILLSCINIRYAYLDRKSTELNSQRTKAKYKLLTQKDTLLHELGVFVFHVLTTTEDSYIKEKTMDIYPIDWEYWDETHTSVDWAKLCTQKIDCMDKNLLLSKMRDSDNRLSHVGTLKQTAFTEVMDFIKSSFESVDVRTDFDVKEIIFSLIDKTPIAEGVLSKFGI